jgi:hypothetical protein
MKGLIEINNEDGSRFKPTFDRQTQALELDY